MKKVEMVIAGKLALVDCDMIKKVIRKDMLVATALDLQTKMNSEKDPICFRLLSESMQETVGKIVRINRTIRKNVQFL